MAVNDISEHRLQEATGKSWAQWLDLFKSIDAKDLPHKDIVKKLAELTDVDGWWLQTVTVKYEQEIGRRVKGQERDGTFTLGVGKVVNGNLDDVYAHWLEVAEAAKSFNGQKIEDVRPSDSEKWRYWRANFADGTRAVVGVHQQKPGKVGFAIDQQKCSSLAQAKDWKAFWRRFVDDTFSSQK